MTLRMMDGHLSFRYKPRRRDSPISLDTRFIFDFPPSANKARKSFSP